MSRNYESLMHPGLSVADYEAIRRRAVDFILRLEEGEGIGVAR